MPNPLAIALMSLQSHLINTLLLPAIRDRESSGDNQAYCVSEQAAGPYQIRPAYLQDANEWRKARNLPTFSKRDRYRPEAARAILLSYMARYKPRTWEELARMHNGGPKGHKRASTLPYWEDIRARIRRRLQNAPRTP